jgi:transcriptional regulator with XRE-family HTH domain
MPATRLSLWRRRQGYSLRQLERITGYNFCWLGDVERDQRICRAQRQVLLARRLRVPIARIFNPASSHTALVSCA